jgi:hypothetical protein
MLVLDPLKRALAGDVAILHQVRKKQIFILV